MKVKKISVQTPKKINFKIKNFYLQGKLKLKKLLKDVFEKKQVVTNEVDYPRVLPNSISAKDEKFSTTGGGYLRYFQEDLEKMKAMSAEEITKFKRQLLEKKKYYVE